MSDTPLTDTNTGYAYCVTGMNMTTDLVIKHGGPFVLASYARELERENAALRDALKIGELPDPMWSKDDLCFQYQQALHERDEEVEMRKKLEHENAELRKDKKRLDWLEKRANFIEVGFCDISPTREDIDEVMEAGEGGAS